VVVAPIGAMRWGGLFDGAGIGNQAVVWAKGMALAQSLDAELAVVLPLRTKHAFLRDFGLSRPVATLAGAAVKGLMRAGRTWTYRRDLWMEAPEDFPGATARLRAEGPSNRHASVVPVHRNLDGLFFVGRQALPELRRYFDRLFASQDIARRPPATGADGLRIAIHLRSGDFSDAGREVLVGAANQRWPLDWYLHRTGAAIEAARRLGKAPAVFIASDSRAAAGDLVRGLEDRGWASQVDSIQRGGGSSAVDLAALADAQYLVASGSTFSLLAACLSDAPFCWHADHLLTESGLGWQAPPFLRGADAIRTHHLQSRNAAEARLLRAVAVPDSAPGGPAWAVELEAISKRLTLPLGADAGGAVPDWADFSVGGPAELLSP
jgi:hypothetical protein